MQFNCIQCVSSPGWRSIANTFSGNFSNWAGCLVQLFLSENPGLFGVNECTPAALEVQRPRSPWAAGQYPPKSPPEKLFVRFAGCANPFMTEPTVSLILFQGNELGLNEGWGASEKLSSWCVVCMSYMRWDETECLNESNWLVLLVMFRNSGGLQIAIAVGSTALTYLAIKPTTWGQCGNRMQQGFISVGKGVKARCKLLVRWKKCKKRQYSNQKKVSQETWVASNQIQRNVECTSHLFNPVYVYRSKLLNSRPHLPVLPYGARPAKVSCMEDCISAR